jgi:hypothetical protein
VACGLLPAAGGILPKNGGDFPNNMSPRAVAPHRALRAKEGLLSKTALFSNHNMLSACLSLDGAEETCAHGRVGDCFLVCTRVRQQHCL